jgi:hypothetical protein
MTDTELLDWLSAQRGARWQPIRSDWHGGSGEGKAYVEGMRVKLFTEYSQWVYGIDLRNAIEVAMVSGRLKGRRIP